MSEALQVIQEPVKRTFKKEDGLYFITEETKTTMIFKEDQYKELLQEQEEALKEKVMSISPSRIEDVRRTIEELDASIIEGKRLLE